MVGSIFNASDVTYMYLVSIFFVHDMSKCRSSQNKDVQYNLFLKLYLFELQDVFRTFEFTISGYILFFSKHLKLSNF